MALPTVFTSGDVFTAANANLLRSNQYNKTTSTKTVSYVLVAADVGTRVLMNAAGSTTITVNTSLFAAGDTLEISNIGAGVCTITSGTCTVTSSSSLALAQYQSGTLLFTSASAAIFIASAVTATAAGLVLITTGTLTAAASVTVDGCFTTAYNSYLLLVDVTSSAAGSLTLQQRSAGSTITAANYQWFRTGYNNAGAADNTNANGATSWVFGYGSATAAIPSVFTINIFNPLASRQSNHNAFGTSTNAADGATAVYSTGFRYTASQAFDGFVLAASAGNLTGTIRVYGISK